MADTLDPAVATLLTEWERLRDAPPHARSHEWAPAVRALVPRLMAVRDGHMADNATAQADAPSLSAPGLEGVLASHERAIKACTVALGEMTFALGLSSIPA